MNEDAQSLPSQYTGIEAHNYSPHSRFSGTICILCNISSIGSLGDRHQTAQENGVQMAT